jgi:predicted DNA-binding helix-hairpin-helix protein
MREHRLYQSDWLMRFYDYQPNEVAAAADEATGPPAAACAICGSR